MGSEAQGHPSLATAGRGQHSYMRPWRKGVGEEKQGREGKERCAGDLNHGSMSPNIVKNLRTGRSGL